MIREIFLKKQPQQLQVVKDYFTALFRSNRIGDKVEVATRAIGIRPCAGCKKRKRILNGESN